MTRTGWYKLGYVAAVLVLGAVTLMALWFQGGGPGVVAVVAIALLVPGRIVGAYYRDLFRGRRLLDLHAPEASIAYTTRFLEWVRARPGRKRLLWLAWSVYTPDAEAMALNNLGVAHLQMGKLDAAATALRAALAVDPRYPIPYYNLAIERELSDDRGEATRLLAEAERLGLRGTTIDSLIIEAQALLARVEGRNVRGVPSFVNGGHER
jgi:tetratricopeptide (TPR) repeat protein